MQPLSPYEDGPPRETQWWNNDRDLSRLRHGTARRRSASLARRMETDLQNAPISGRQAYPHDWTEWFWQDAPPYCSRICIFSRIGRLSPSIRKANCSRTLRWSARSDRCHRIILIDPFSVVSTTYPNLAKHIDCQSRGFNPVTCLDPGSLRFIDDAKSLAVALIKTDDNRDKYWAQAAQALIKGLSWAFGYAAAMRLRSSICATCSGSLRRNWQTTSLDDRALGGGMACGCGEPRRVHGFQRRR